MTTVYLCGGINGLNDQQAKDWREVAKALFGPAGVGTLDPMRRDYRGKEAESVKAIVDGDLQDIDHSDVVLVNASRPSWGTAMEIVYASRPSWGTAMEIVYAYKANYRPMIYAFGAGEKPSPWLIWHCKRLFPDVESAVAHIIQERYER